ncbi:uroporphyrinogen-III synthase [Methylobacterium sp. BE186]|uniref:uroporphyrinogen-III synthase n=1 Tax=Methylobacterium sp. BE186 TaxID=2817715 RepID=UPI00285433A0|nr:uroporphyrinogen-III synthase [Methylobacterium sp. BE186]MDR7037707.1 uroporphyrinogen-III synthase [Methylobacterium sp. BE186]
MRIWVSRPEPGASRTGRRLAELGHEPLVAPVLAVRPTGTPLPPGRPDAILLTSANGAEALGRTPGMEGLRAIPVLAVGARTAAAARAAGLGPVEEAEGDGAALAGRVRARFAPGCRLLLAAGEDRKAEPAASLAAAGYEVALLVAYAAEAVAGLPEAAAQALAAGRLDAALHYSRRSAEVAYERAAAAGHGGAFGRLRHYCLSDDVAAPLEARGIAAHFVAMRPREEDLLAGLADRF